jgi:hypothetical protein
MEHTYPDVLICPEPPSSREEILLRQPPISFRQFCKYSFLGLLALLVPMGIVLLLTGDWEKFGVGLLAINAIVSIGIILFQFGCWLHSNSPGIKKFREMELQRAEYEEALLTGTSDRDRALLKAKKEAFIAANEALLKWYLDRGLMGNKSAK